MTIIISHDEPESVFAAVKVRFSPTFAVERGEHTCIESDDELDGAELLARVVGLIHEIRGEVD